MKKTIFVTLFLVHFKTFWKQYTVQSLILLFFFLNNLENT
jgi:hypothetical protein